MRTRARIRSCAALLLLAGACSSAPPPVPPAPPAPKPAGLSPCSQDMDPEHAFEPFVATLSDPAAEPSRRAEAVHGLGCLVAKTEPDPTVARALVAFFSLSVSEWVRPPPDPRDPAHKLLPADRLPAAAAAVGQAFCDPSPEVSSTAELELRTMPGPVAALALSRVVRSCDTPRAVVAVGVLKERLDRLVQGVLAYATGGNSALWRVPGLDPHSSLHPWTDLEAVTAVLNVAAASKKADVRAPAKEALARADASVDPLAHTWAETADPGVMSGVRRQWTLPLLWSAFKRATPAFRARLTDPDYRIRLVAAQIVWVLEGAGPSALDALAKDLWTGVRVPLSVDPAAGATLEKMLGQLDPPPPFLFVELGTELGRLADQGPSAAPALGALRRCLTIPEKKLRAIDAHKGCAVAIAFISQDRASLRPLRKDYNPFFADSGPMAFGGVYGDMAARAILTVEPDDPKARRALGFERGPLLDLVTRRAIQAQAAEAWLRILLLRQHGG